MADSLKLAPLATRSYGSNSQAARQSGADLIDASLYGLAAAIADTKIEDALDGLMGAYGVGKYDVQFKNAFKRLSKNETEKKLLGIAASVVGEGFEGFIVNVVNQTLKSLYNGKDSIQSFSETAWDKALYNALVDGIIGVSGGVKSEVFSK